MNKITDTGIFVVILVFILAVSGIAGYFGFTVEGTPEIGKGVVKESPNVFGIIDWAWQSLKFMFLMMIFKVKDIPAFFNVIWLLMWICMIWVLVRLIRGTSSG